MRGGQQFQWDMVPLPPDALAATQGDHGVAPPQRVVGAIATQGVALPPGVAAVPIVLSGAFVATQGAEPTVVHVLNCHGTKPLGNGGLHTFVLKLWSDAHCTVRDGPPHGEWIMSPSGDYILATFSTTDRDPITTTMQRVATNTYLKTSCTAWEYQFVAILKDA